MAAPAVRNATDGIAEAYLALAATLRQQDASDSAQVLLRLALDMRPGPHRGAAAAGRYRRMRRKRPAAALATLAAVRRTTR